MVDGPSIGSRNGDGGGLTWLSAGRLAEMVAQGEVSSVEVVRHFLDRIEEHDGELNAFRRVDATGALAQAERADRAVRDGEALGRLHGVPVAFKESFVVEGFPMPGTYRSSGADGAAEPRLAAIDDIEVERLRTAGAVVLGVTVATVGLSADVPDAALLPRNPWNTARTAGSSSAGNGPAVAGGLVPLVLGDDGGGSTRVPSAFCGLIGVSPTRGRVPHIDYRSTAPRTTVTVGPMVRSVEDAALGLQLIAGPDGRDFVCLQDDPPDYLDGLDAGVVGRRFLWTDDFGLPPSAPPSGDPRVVAAVRGAARELERIGGVVEDVDMGWEDPQVTWMAQVFMSREAERTPYGSPPNAEVVEALASRDRNWRRFRAAFAEYDFVLSPTKSIIAPEIGEWIEMASHMGEGEWKRIPFLDEGGTQPLLCNALGLPAVTVPAGFVDGMPIGLHVIGGPGSEKELLQVAQAFLARPAA